MTDLMGAPPPMKREPIWEPSLFHFGSPSFEIQRAALANALVFSLRDLPGFGENLHVFECVIESGVERPGHKRLHQRAKHTVRVGGDPQIHLSLFWADGVNRCVVGDVGDELRDLAGCGFERVGPLFGIVGGECLVDGAEPRRLADAAANSCALGNRNRAVRSRAVNAAGPLAGRGGS